MVGMNKQTALDIIVLLVHAQKDIQKMQLNIFKNKSTYKTVDDVEASARAISFLKELISTVE